MHTLLSALKTFRASKTFFFASLLFPPYIRNDIFVLYSFLRKVDDLVDSNPPDMLAFQKIKTELLKSLDGTFNSKDHDVQGLLGVLHKYSIPPKLIADYLEAQERDVKIKQYRDQKDIDFFIYGVAEVVGLCLAYIMKIPEPAHTSARALGHGMQLVNIARDIREDAQDNKCYISEATLKTFGFSSPLTVEALLKNTNATGDLVLEIVNQASSQIEKARDGVAKLPQDCKAPILASIKLYAHTIYLIRKDPVSVLYKKVRPNIFEIAKVYASQKRAPHDTM